MNTETKVDPEISLQSREAAPETAVGETLTVIVPTFNERANVEELIGRVGRALPRPGVELLFVDDSTDDTPVVIESVGHSAGLPVRLLHRSPAERIGGLGGAVVAGLRASSSEWVVVMDADLQHPPEMVPTLLARARAGGRDELDVVVASRYVKGGTASGLAGWGRRVVSSAAGWVARALFPRRTSGCSDVMSGFFVVRRAAVDPQVLRPDGFKILLEILTRSCNLRLGEVPFTFGQRHAGDSKASLRQGMVYVRHLLRLRLAGTTGAILGFLAIGASGVAPNLAVTWVLIWANWHYLAATATATAAAVSWNFMLTEWLLFRGRRSGSLMRRYVSYGALAGVDVFVRVPLVAAAVEWAAIPVMAATTASIALFASFRFLLLDRLIYGPTMDPTPPGGVLEASSDRVMSEEVSRAA